jgi:hypothetical protein
MKAFGECRYSSTILELSTRCRWVVSFMVWPLYPRGERSLSPLDRRLDGGSEFVWTLWIKEKSLASSANWTLAISRCYTGSAIPTQIMQRLILRRYMSGSGRGQFFCIIATFSWRVEKPAKLVEDTWYLGPRFEYKNSRIRIRNIAGRFGIFCEWE